MPKQNVCSKDFVKLIMHIIGSGVTRGLSQRGRFSWKSPTN